MIIGTGKPVFYCNDPSIPITLFFTPGKWWKQIDRKAISSSLLKNSKRSADRKFIEKGNRLEYTYKFEDLTYDEISYLKLFRGRTILFQEHDDYASSFYANVRSVVDQMQNGKFDRYIVIMKILTVGYQEYGDKYESYYHFHSGDIITTPILVPDETFLFELDYKRLHADYTKTVFFGGGSMDTKGYSFYWDTQRKLTFSRIDLTGGGLFATIRTVPTLLPDDEFTNIKIIRYSGGLVEIFKNDIQLTLDVGSDTYDYSGVNDNQFIIGKSQNSPENVSYMQEALVKNIVLLASAGDTKSFNYKCNEKEPPFPETSLTKYVSDWRSDNHGTPTVADRNEFFNRIKLDS
jgi:hypothetical protein